MRTPEEIAEAITKGNLEVWLEEEIEAASKTRPFLIFQHTVNKPTEQNKRSTPEERLFVLYLDAVHSNLATIHRLEMEGARVKYSHFPEIQDPEHRRTVSDIQAWVQSTGEQAAKLKAAYKDELRAEILAEMGGEQPAGVREKLAKKNKSEANALQ